MLSYVFGLSGASGFGSRSTSTSVANEYKHLIPGKIVFITGCNSGIGKENVREFIRHNASDVIMACRTERKMELCEEEFEKEFPNSSTNLHLIECDLADFESIERAATAFEALKLPRIDVLINNAGVMMTPYGQTAQGFETQVGTNFLGHFVLTNRLFPFLKKSSAPRVVNLASSAHNWAGEGGIRFDAWKYKAEESAAYDNRTAYGQSKILNIVHSIMLQKKAEAAGVPLICVSAHPGVIPDTGLFKHINPAVRGVSIVFGKVFLKSLKQGAATSMYCALSPDVEKHKGEYFADCNVAAWTSSLVGCDYDIVWNEAVKATNSDIALK